MKKYINNSELPVKISGTRFTVLPGETVKLDNSIYIVGLDEVKTVKEVKEEFKIDIVDTVDTKVLTKKKK